jgi:hypothetical protein
MRKRLSKDGQVWYYFILSIENTLGGTYGSEV